MLNKINISPNKKKLIVYLVLTVVTLAVFWQVNQHDFINLDDPFYVTQNNHIQSGITTNGLSWAFSTRYLDLWNPLIWISFMFDYQLYGLDAGGYHRTNLILHILSTLLLFWLFHRMTKEIWKSAFVAAFFALHPLHVESVTWIVERKDVLSAFFWMLTLCLYVYYTEKPVIRRYLLVLFSFVCALMSKPMVVTLPVIMILLDYWPLKRYRLREDATKLKEVISVSDKDKKTKSKKGVLKKSVPPNNGKKLPKDKFTGIIPLWQIWEKIPFFILSAITIFITLYSPNEQEKFLKSFSLSPRLANALVAFVTYLEKTFWPHDMAIFYPFSDQLPIWQILGSSLLIIVISIIAIVMVRRLPYLFVGWFWYMITILPVIGIIQISLSTPYAMADRYHYLPSIGLGVMLAWGIPLLIKSEDSRKKILFPAAIAAVAMMAILTWQQCGYWKNSIALFNHALHVTKNNYLAQNNRGIVYAKLGQYQLALEDFNAAIRIKPDYTCSFNNRGNAYTELGQYQQAIEDYNKAIDLKPTNAEAYSNRGISYLLQGKKESGCPDLQKACALGKCEYIEIAKNKGDCR